MMVTFVSLCEKNALKKTRRILDAYADRIGDNTWQTLITQEGLLTVKKLLRKTASRSTAVSCHWIRSRSRSDLIWVVGKRDRFDEVGRVAVNFTSSDVEIFQDKTKWMSVKLIQYAAAIAGLFHDFGKANKLFQDKINPDVKTSTFEPYRHEWISLRLFQAFVGKQTDSEWLDTLTDINPRAIASCFRDGVDGNFNQENHPLLIENLAPIARLVAWIIVSHHRLPILPAWDKNLNQSASFKDIDEWLGTNFSAVWNSYRCHDIDQIERVEENWSFGEQALPYFSSHWRAKACNLASEAKQELSAWLVTADQDLINGCLFTSHLARLSMMLADHYYSARPNVTQKWRGLNYKVYANSDRETKQLKQQLDEHLIGVAHHAERIVKKLPTLKSSLPSLDESELLNNAVPKKFKDNFGWQDKAVKETEAIASLTERQGFFGINMASTGKGKTIANAKIMYALGQVSGGGRFCVALGLRALTLQTGREFRTSLDLSEEQLAILVGGAAVTQLFENAQSNQVLEKEIEEGGSESGQEILQDDLFVHYSGALKEHSLSEWVEKDHRLQKLLCAPVLVSTIDHLMPATEGTKGGRQIGPMLRLLTSDLVLDEPDDFGLEDLPALCRLVHWAGMLGSRVLLSTATMPPALAYALFHSYKAGWEQYAKDNIDAWNGEVCCAWFDEFTSDSLSAGEFRSFKARHEKFVASRLNVLAKNTKPKRLADIVTVSNDGESLIESVAATCYAGLQQLHQYHHVHRGDVRVSVGLIRMANINPLVSVAKALLRKPSPIETRIHFCVYHSRFPLAVRSHIENRLDAVLSRKDESLFWERKEITDVLARHPEVKNHIFVVLASPVAEVGRDHDYDWAIVEPSSIRSMIQLAGRILRHRERDQPLLHPNILLLNKNYKALEGKDICFERPGFETKALCMTKHDLYDILPKALYQTIDASPRIQMPLGIEKMIAKAKPENLNELEHIALMQQLFLNEKSAKAWWKHQSFWCGEVQRQQPFRRSEKDEAYYLYVEDEYKGPKWHWLDESVFPPKLGDVSSTGISIKELNTLDVAEGCGFWFELNALSVYSQLAEGFDMSLTEVSRRFGEVRVTMYKGEKSSEYQHHAELGLFQEVDE
ncbi:type I-F CRISPR-associated helicase Cas3f [Oceaniserpentilla sp. 4NH20-0058]|uniref:type I-F CRISPR-associated helicase Cas3f n=1 Tax=Oceaniserpentilla sp. 4NH20-0058 TaxID=3127660 RepID=UPI0031033B12